MNCQPRLMSLSYPWVYYQSSPVIGGQMTKANEPNLPMVILRQVPAVALSFWLITSNSQVAHTHLPRPAKPQGPVEEEERKLYFNNLLHIHQHTFLIYMIQSVIEGNIRRQICMYTIFPYNRSTLNKNQYNFRLM